MIAAILWTFLGALLGALAVALSAWKKAERIALLEKANKRLLADVATASVNNVALERRLKFAEDERDKWRLVSTS